MKAEKSRPGEKAAQLNEVTATIPIITGVVSLDLSDTTLATPEHVIRGRIFDAIALAAPGTQVRLNIGARDRVDPWAVAQLLEKPLHIEVVGCTAEAVRAWVRALRRDPAADWLDAFDAPTAWAGGVL